MEFAISLFQDLADYATRIRGFNRNIHLLLLGSILGGIAQGIIDVNFNLYVLSLGITPESLGRILSAGPFAHAVASIPIGFLGEALGYRTAFILIYAVTGLSQVAQVATSRAVLIAAAAFVGGLALSGNFVVRLPFLAVNSAPTERVHVFTLNSVLHGATYAAGSLLAGYLPNGLARLGLDLTHQYRYTLYFAGALTLLAVIPLLYLDTPRITRQYRSKISLSPYLWGIERFTVESSAVELFIGLTLGLVAPFMNIFFIYRLGTTREFFSTITALNVIPVTLTTLLGPVLALRLGRQRTITISRYLIPLTTLALALTSNVLLAAGAFWSYRALFSMSQALWFAYAMERATTRSKMATSAWLEITFWIGQGFAALVTGVLLGQSNYTLPFYLSTGAALITAILTQLVVHTPKPTAQVSSKP